jgi:hypothetical protein
MEVATVAAERSKEDQKPKPMPLTFEQRKECQRLGPDNVRRQLAYAGPGAGSIVPGLGDGMMLRGDVQEWLAEIERKNTRGTEAGDREHIVLGKVAAWAGIIGIVVPIVIALLGH